MPTLWKQELSILYQTLTPKVCSLLKFVLEVDKHIFPIQSQCIECWWPGAPFTKMV